MDRGRVAAMAPLMIAVAQTSISADPRANGSVVRSAMRRAADQGARLIQFPEGALSGYANAQIQSWEDVDWAVIAEEVDRVVELAGELRLWVVLGCAHRLTGPNRPHNSMYVVSDRGTVVDRYDKRMCSNTEITRFYSPGFDPVVFQVDGLKFGSAVCIEVNFPELFAEYERLGVDCVLLSAYPIDEVLAVKARAHAAINNYWIALSAPAQTADLFRSGLIGPDGVTIAQVQPGGDLVTAEIDRSPRSFTLRCNSPARGAPKPAPVTSTPAAGCRTPAAPTTQPGDQRSAVIGPALGEAGSQDRRPDRNGIGISTFPADGHNAGQLVDVAQRRSRQGQLNRACLCGRELPRWRGVAVGPEALVPVFRRVVPLR